MKPFSRWIVVLVALALPLGLGGGAHGQTAKISKEALAAIEKKPKKKKPLLVTKSLTPKTTGKPTEKERQYLFDKGARVVVLTDGTEVTSPLVDIPLLFEQNKAVLTDPQSLANLGLLASKLKELAKDGAKFSIEGHASAEGTVAENQILSEQRAASILAKLIGKEYGVPAGIFVSAQGFGERHHTHPDTAPEYLLAKDRRVLIVREE